MAAPSGETGATGIASRGKPRNIAVCFLLTVITLGVYAFVWTTKTHSEIKRASGVGVGGLLGFVIYLFVSPVTFFLIPSEIGQMLNRFGRPSRVKGTTGFWLFLPLVGPIVWFIKNQGQLNEFWRTA